MPYARPPALPSLAPHPALLGPAAFLAAAPDLGFLAFLLGAELVSAFAAWSEKALDSVSRADLLEAARARGESARAERLLAHQAAYLLSARILRFLGKAALVVGLASWLLGDELPYSIAVAVDAFTQEGSLRRISATIYVDKASHKAIVIGEKGATLKRIGTEARHAMEALFGGKVFLETHVKVKSGWADNEAALRRLGY